MTGAGGDILTDRICDSWLGLESYLMTELG